MDLTVNHRIVVDGRTGNKTSTMVMRNERNGRTTHCKTKHRGAVMGHKTNNMIWVCLKMVYTPLVGGSEHELYFSLFFHILGSS